MLKNHSPRRPLCRPKPVNLTDFLTIARSSEISERQATLMETTNEVNRIKNHYEKQPDNMKSKRKTHKRGKYSNRYSANDYEQIAKKCFGSGEAWPHTGGKLLCPAYGKACHKCMKNNHFGKVCRAKVPVNNILDVVDTAESSSDSNDDSIHSLRICNRNKCVSNIKSIHTVAENVVSKLIPTITKITLNETLVEIQIDSGSDVNIISERTYEILKIKTKLHSTNIKLYPFASRHPLLLLGKFTAIIETPKIFDHAVFYVVKKISWDVRNILGVKRLQS